jgi:threonylcarbamoyladenosine tRNA methylthiotransferase MtaB
MKAFLRTFGCRVNQSESEALARRLSLVDDLAQADVCILNTCTVTRRADADALLLLRRIRRRNPGARVIVTGCLATRSPAEIESAFPGATVVKNPDKDGIPALLGEEEREAAVRARSRVTLKVQDGCAGGCTYCIVPSVRPEMRSTPLDGVVRQAEALLEEGVREIVLCGVRLGAYRSGEHDLVGLLERLLALPCDFRVRLSSFGVREVTEDFLTLLDRAGEKLCPSFHIPLQSGADSVLRRMNRSYDAAFYSGRIAALRSRRPDCGLFTDVIVGFPGETEAEAEESLRFVEKTGFSGLHVFRFSKREGTLAAAMHGQVPAKTAEARSRRLKELDAALRSEFASRAVGSVRRVVAEPRAGRVEATTDHFLRVRLDRDPGPGLHRARVVSAGPGLPEAAVEML